MKTPAFWYKNTPTPLAQFLAPLSALYKTIARRHQARATPEHMDIPVLCVGNLVAGGSGKTPVAIALSKLLNAHHISQSAAFLTRGYGGNVQGPEAVNSATPDPQMWGDEALLLAHHAPTIVAKDRAAGAKYAEDTGADLIILDDGLQNYSLSKDISFCVVDGFSGFGNKQVLPAGPLRQPLEDGFKGIDACILIGDDTRNVRKDIPDHIQIFTAQLVPTNLDDLPDSVSYFAFCGIGVPDKFRKTLLDHSFNIIGFYDFPDHHPYTLHDLSGLVQQALDQNTRLITTEKDFVRLPEFPQKTMIDVLSVDVVFDAPDDVAAFIKGKLCR